MHHQKSQTNDYYNNYYNQKQNLLLRLAAGRRYSPLPLSQLIWTSIVNAQPKEAVWIRRGMIRYMI